MAAVRVAPRFTSLAHAVLYGAEKTSMLHGRRDVGRVFTLAWIVDVVYQVVMLQTFRPGQALLVAALLAFVPYVVLRGLTTRVVRRAPSFRRLGA